MEFISQFLPIVVYVLLIALIIVGIILGIKIIITIDKVTRLVDDVNEKFQKISPLLNTVGMISDKMSDIVGTVFNAIQNVFMRLFLSNRKKEESEDNE